ncbi:MAG: isocitrate lyase/PEP mutase family protein [Actinomycetota bacterium]|nr:isocitrate lyase/PEP mutase family protein [Actinomycetota bacterium]MDD5668054.1 isocitrate lyase/PEP mutase family protein [Actinomycetota bacterium]
MAGNTLKELIEAKELVVAPGIFNPLTAMIAESRGFEAVYMTGYGTATMNHGYPDLGLVTMTEMVENAARIAAAVEIPVIADADTGYGNPINMVRTVREYEKAGVAAIHIEDQVWPKRCGHMTGKAVIAADDMAAKIRAAADARSNPDFLIIARTDALAIHGLDHAVDRGRMYAEAGADVLFIEAPTTVDEMAEIPRRLPEKPHLVNMAPRTPNLPVEDLEKMGFSIALFPGICLAACITACIEELQAFKENGKQRDFSEWIQSFTDLNDFLKVPYYLELDSKYRSKSEE